MAVRETYISRILSALSDGVAKVDEKIKEVISIWICIDARKNEDSIIEYQLMTGSKNLVKIFTPKR